MAIKFTVIPGHGQGIIGGVTGQALNPACRALSLLRP
jgi:hypothetical protein